MPGARELVNRAKAQNPAPAADKIRVQAAPVPLQAEAAQKNANAPQLRITARPIREKSIYRSIMQSHDRFSTRHLKP